MVDKEGKTREIDIWVLTWADLAGSLGIEAEERGQVQDESGLFSKTNYNDPVGGDGRAIYM